MYNDIFRKPFEQSYILSIAIFNNEKKCMRLATNFQN